MVSKLTIALIALLLLNPSASWAEGNIKGNLDRDEIAFLNQTVDPILIGSKLCTSAADCNSKNYIFCSSYETLSCDVYGITDEKVIKEIFFSMLYSGLRVSSFSFWRSNYHERSLFERPILSFTDRTGSK